MLKEVAVDDLEPNPAVSGGIIIENEKVTAAGFNPAQVKFRS